MKKYLNIKKEIKKRYPREFQVEDVKADLTTIDVLVEMLKGNNVYDFARAGKEHLDSAVREEIFEITSDDLGIDYQVLYHLWRNDEQCKKVSKHIDFIIKK